jgi:Xaa-Pro aminopeptidase
VPEKAYWLAFQDWVSDIRPSFFSLDDALIERLEELGMERGRIGIAGLALVPRQADGIVSSGTVEKIRAAFPEAELVNATFLMDEARFVKSEEEIAFLRQAVALVERAIEVLMCEARPGVAENVVYARMQAAMVEAGGELPMMLLWSSGNPQPLSNAFMPTRSKLAKGDIISAEIEARWAGYAGQVTIPAVIGKVPATTRRCSASSRRRCRPRTSA